MPYDKEKLIKLISLVKEIIEKPGNEWMKYELGMIHIDNNRENWQLPSGYINFLKKQYRLKAREFYKSISESGLKEELIKDYQEMLWYKMLNNIERQYLFAFYQIENIINYYLIKNNPFENIKNNPEKYKIKYNEKFSIETYSYFFDKNGNPREIHRIVSIPSKLAYWAVETNNVGWLLDKPIKFHMDILVKIRNSVSHRNYMEDNESLRIYIEEFKRGDDSNHGYIIRIIKKIKSSI